MLGAAVGERDAAFGHGGGGERGEEGGLFSRAGV